MDEQREFLTKEEWDDYAAKVGRFNSFRFGDWTFDWVSGVAGGEQLTKQENDMLYILCKTAPGAIHKSRLADMMKSKQGYAISEMDVKVIIRRVRDKIGKERIVTHFGHGYRFVPFPEPPSPSSAGRLAASDGSIPD